MERTPDNPTPDEPEQSGISEKDSKKKKLRAAAAASSALSAPESSEASRPIPAPNAFEQLLARLAATEAGKVKPEPAKVESHEPIESVTDADSVVQETSGDASSDLTSEDQAAEQWVDRFESYQLPSDYAAGEMLLDLSGDTEEHELPLYVPGETADSVYLPFMGQAEAPELSVVSEVAQETPGPEPTPGEHVPEAAETPESEPTPRLVPVPAELQNIHADKFKFLGSQAAPEGSVPPSVPETPATPVQPENPYTPQYHAMQNMAANVAPTSQTGQAESGISKADLEDAVHRATKVGQSRGVVTGLLVGAGYEHFKHKRREKRTAKRHEETTKKLNEARRNYAFGMEQQAKQKTEYMTQTAESSEQLAATQRRVGELERQRQLYPTTEQQMSAANTPKPRAERVLQPVIENEQLVVAPEHRLQTSSWHSIEVDARTGRVVENPAFEYGHEYYREQAQENALGLPPAQDTFEQKVPVAATAAQSPGARTGRVTGHQAQGGLSGMSAVAPQSAAPMDSSSTEQLANPAQQPIPQATQALTKPTQQAAPIWPLILALVIIVVCLSLALR